MVQQPPREGTDDEVSLRDYVDVRLEDANTRYQQRFDAQTIAVNAALLAAKEAIGAALLAAEKAVAKAEAASERRFDSVNEFRQALNDQNNTLVPRIEFDARVNALSEKLEVLARRAERSEGAGGGLKAGWGYLVGGIGMLATVVLMVIALVKLTP